VDCYCWCCWMPLLLLRQGLTLLLGLLLLLLPLLGCA
jgi:hypothetical protein